MTFFQRPTIRRLHRTNEVLWTVQMYETCSFKWIVVKWIAYITPIWTVQMDDGPMNRLCYSGYSVQPSLLLAATVNRPCGPIEFFFLLL